MKLKHGSLFSGIGCAEYASEKAGFENVFSCEIDPFCTKILQKHYPKSRHFSDVSQMGVLPDCDVLTFGFPCQDASCARGVRMKNPLEGERTGLFYEAVRLIRTNPPRVIIAENVAALLSKSGKTVICELAKIGYTVGWAIVTAAQFGGAHKRARVFFIGALGGTALEMSAILKAVHGYPLRYVTPNLERFQDSTPESNRKFWCSEAERVKGVGNGIFIPCLDSLFFAIAPVFETPAKLAVAPILPRDMFGSEYIAASDLPENGIFDGRLHGVSIRKKKLGLMAYNTPLASDGHRISQFSTRAIVKQITENPKAFSGFVQKWCAKYGIKPNADIFEAVMGLPVGYTKV
jgi:C-5 cytosine-specific DNA methylase